MSWRNDSLKVDSQAFVYTLLPLVKNFKTYVYIKDLREIKYIHCEGVAAYMQIRRSILKFCQSDKILTPICVFKVLFFVY